MQDSSFCKETEKDIGCNSNKCKFTRTRVLAWETQIEQRAIENQASCFAFK